MPTQIMACPECGLTLIVETDNTAPDFTYDAEEWKRLCKCPDLGSPVFCIPSRQMMLLRPPPPKRQRS